MEEATSLDLILKGANIPGFAGELRNEELEKTKVQIMAPAPTTKAVAASVLSRSKFCAISACLNFGLEDELIHFCAEKLGGKPCLLTER